MGTYCANGRQEFNDWYQQNLCIGYSKNDAADISTNPSSESNKNGNINWLNIFKCNDYR